MIFFICSCKENTAASLGDWASVGACVLALIAIIVSIFQQKGQLKLSRQIDERHSEREKLQVNISLFSQRYELYNCVMKYVNISKLYLSISREYEKCKETLKQELEGKIFDEFKIPSKKTENDVRMMIINDRAMVKQIRFLYSDLPEEFLKDIENLIFSLTAVVLAIIQGDIFKNEYNNWKDCYSDELMKEIKDRLEEPLKLRYMS
ncbi:MAG: hypothetical protein SOZ84_00410 [Treponema sp.]|nr:hypothetical protein [Treponema sp.]